MENKKGSGIFLGVVSVATLIVAIIGATFAFFSASANSTEDAVNVEAYQFTVSMTMNRLSDTAGKMIPLNPTTEVSHETYNNNMLYAMNVGTDSNICVDSKGFKVCELYELSFSNSSDQDVELTGEMVTTLNTDAEGTTGEEKGFQNLKAQLVTNDGTSYALDTTNPAVKLPIEANGRIALTAAENKITISANATEQKAYLVVWLDDTKEGVEQSKEMGSKYNGQVVFNSTAGGNLTGTFTVDGAPAA